MDDDALCTYDRRDYSRTGSSFKAFNRGTIRSFTENQQAVFIFRSAENDLEPWLGHGAEDGCGEGK